MMLTMVLFSLEILEVRLCEIQTMFERSHCLFGLWFKLFESFTGFHYCPCDLALSLKFSILLFMSLAHYTWIHSNMVITSPISCKME